MLPLVLRRISVPSALVRFAALIQYEVFKSLTRKRTPQNPGCFDLLPARRPSVLPLPHK